MFRIITCIFLVILLSACGGGGGGAPTSTQPIEPPSSDGGNQIFFEPPLAELTSYQGERGSIQVKVILNPPIVQSVGVKITDDQGVLQGASIEAFDNGSSARALLNISDKLSPRVYEGVFSISLCVDDPRVCAQPFANRVWRYPYRITIKSYPNFTALTPLGGAGEWMNSQGNLAHTGYVPSVVDANLISLRFKYRRDGEFFSSSYGALVTKGENVYFTSRADGAAEALHSVNEALGKENWISQIPVGKIPLLMGESSLFLGTSFGMREYDLDSGRMLQEREAEKNFSDGVYDGGEIYYGNSSYRTLWSYGSARKINARDYSVKWNRLFWNEVVENSPPSLDSSRAYFYQKISSESNASQLLVLDKWTGSVRATIGAARNSLYEYSSAPVLCDDKTAVVSVGPSGSTAKLRVFDISSLLLKYEIDGNYSPDEVACDTSTMYVVGKTGLEARRISDGSLLWSWNAPADDKIFSDLNGGFLNSNLILFKNMIFISLEKRIYAVDLSSHQTAWSDRVEQRSKLAVSRNGVLYASGWFVYAFNLH